MARFKGFRKVEKHCEVQMECLNAFGCKEQPVALPLPQRKVPVSDTARIFPNESGPKMKECVLCEALGTAYPVSNSEWDSEGAVRNNM